MINTKNNLLGLLMGVSAILLLSCQKDDSLQQCTSLDSHVVGKLNGKSYCAEIFELELNGENTLLINADRKSAKEGTEFEQLTIRIAFFGGEGSYDLLVGDAVGMYREWCCGDILTYVAYTGMSPGDSGNVRITEFDDSSGMIKGTVVFKASDHDGENLRFKGSFEGRIAE